MNWSGGNNVAFKLSDMNGGWKIEETLMHIFLIIYLFSFKKKKCVYKLFDLDVENSIDEIV